MISLFKSISFARDLCNVTRLLVTFRTLISRNGYRELKV